MDITDQSSDITIFSEPLTLQDGIYKMPNFSISPNDFPIAVRSNFWKLTASLYEPIWRHKSLSLLTLGKLSVREELKTMIDWLALDPTNSESSNETRQTVLDAGCSAGLYSRHLLQHTTNLNIHALDMSRIFLTEGLHKAQEESLPISFVEADVHNLPYQDASFDVIISGGSLNEFKNTSQVFSEFSRVLKPKAKLWLMFLAESSQLPDKWLQGLSKQGGINFPSQQSVTDDLAANGLKLSKHKRERDIVFLLCEKSA